MIKIDEIKIVVTSSHKKNQCITIIPDKHKSIVKIPVTCDIRSEDIQQLVKILRLFQTAIERID